jgi:polyisoprenoid-binding protein YceI
MEVETMKKLIAGLLLVLSPSLTVAEPMTYTVEPAFTTIAFDVDVGGMFTSHGEFHDFTGTLALDLKHPEQSRVDVTAAASSIGTGWSVADGLLLSEDYFDPSHHPTVRFIADRVEPSGADTVILHGSMTIRDITLPQDFTAKLQDQRNDPAQGQVASFVVTGTIDRDRYGMTANHPLVASTVAVTITARVRLL